MSRIALFLVLIGLVAAGQARAQNAPEGGDDNRFTFSRTGEGYLRLDSRTGQMSLCTRRAVGWACQAVPDERNVLEGEIARLQGENGTLKKELLTRNLPLPEGIRPDSAPPPGSETSRLRVPGEASLNVVVSYVAQVWHGLVDLMVKFQKDVLRRTGT